MSVVFGVFNGGLGELLFIYFNCNELNLFIWYFVLFFGVVFVMLSLICGSYYF